ncbi:hypothetical protein [Streptomyces koelreuteriae]|uniref:hypothetical protein n=1 Tax=Streptomyces koelreuteriae TaxID=2838015 RepID=UPI003EBD2B57
MTDSGGRGKDWGTALVEDFIYPVAVFLAPASLLVLMVFFVIRAFTHGLDDGIRSFAAAALPLVGLAFLSRIVHHSGTTTTRKGPAFAPNVPNYVFFIISVAVSVGAMILLTVSTEAPLSELATSAAFSALAFFSMQSGRHSDRTAIYSLGTVLGALAFIVIAGVPSV